MSKRLFEFAKELGLPSKDVLERCKKLGHNIPSQLTVVDEKIQSDIRRDWGWPTWSFAPLAPLPGPGRRRFQGGPPDLDQNSGYIVFPFRHRSPDDAETRNGLIRAYRHLSGAQALYQAGPHRSPPPPPAGRALRSNPRPSKAGAMAWRPDGPKSVAAVVKEAAEAQPKPEELNADGTPVDPKVLTKIKVTEGITVAELAQKLNVKAGVLIKELLDLKILATINQTAGH